MSVKTRNDRYDIDPRELRLIRVGHYLWGQFKRNRQEPGIEQALEDVLTRKRELRAELRVERAKKADQCHQYFLGKKTRQNPSEALATV